MLPKEVGQRLRVLAARRKTAVAPIVREWIIEKLAAEEVRSPDPDRPTSKAM